MWWWDGSRGDLPADRQPSDLYWALINTAYIERLAGHLPRQAGSSGCAELAPGHTSMYARSGDVLVGSCYNLLWTHRSLGEERTPAMAAGLTNHRWTMEELLTFPTPPAEVPRWRGRKPKWLLEAEDAADHGSMWRYALAMKTWLWNIM